MATPYSLLLRTSLALALAGGFGLGLYLMLGLAGLGIPLSAGTPALMQVHGQVQTVGFVTLFIMAVGVQLFPRFHATRLDRPAWVSLGGLGVAVGVTVRLLSQPLEPSWGRSAALAASGLAIAAGALLAVGAFARVVRGRVSTHGERRVASRLLPATIGTSLVGWLALNLYISLAVLAPGGTIVPTALDEALLHLQLWGFASTMILAVAGRVFPRFLILQPTREGLLPVALGLWLLGSLGVPLAWLLLPDLPAARATGALAQLSGLLVYLYALRLYEASPRASGMPHVTGPTRRWARVAFGFQVAAAGVSVVVAAYEAGGGMVPLTAVSAGRHLLAQGFVLPVIVVMASRILPGYSGWMLHRPRLLGGMIWSLFAGAALRGTAELLGGYRPGWGVGVALGGALAVGAFTVFAVGLWWATARAPRPVL